MLLNAGNANPPADHRPLICQLFQILQDNGGTYITENSLRTALHVPYAQVYKIMRTINTSDDARFAYERISFATFAKFLAALLLEKPPTFRGVLLHALCGVQ